MPPSATDHSLEVVRALEEAVHGLSEALSNSTGGLGGVDRTIPQLIDWAEECCNASVDGMVPWGAATFSIIFRDAVGAAVALSNGRTRTTLLAPTSRRSQPDERVKRVFELEHTRTALLNEMSGLRSGWLRCEQLPGSYRLTLANSRRRSAMSFLRHRALHLSYSEETRNHLGADVDASSREHLTKMFLSSDMQDIAPLRKGLASTWTALLSEIGLTDENVQSFLGFTIATGEALRTWLKRKRLYSLFRHWLAKAGRPIVEPPEFERLLDVLSADFAAAKRAGVVVPFLRMGDWYRLWFFTYHVQSPEVVVALALQTRHPELWSRTIGRDSALVADYLAAMLPTFPNRPVATRRRKKGVGDIDLAVGDVSASILLTCELKAVFDRFRTDLQLSNFTRQRVDFEHAWAQLEASRQAIGDGSWPAHDILSGLDAKLKSVYPMILLWRDNWNPSLDAPIFIPVCDFASFVFLYERFAGDPARIHRVVSELSKIFFASVYAPHDLPIELPHVLSRELEIGGLPPLSFLQKLEIGTDTLALLADMPKLPEGCEEIDGRRPAFTTALARPAAP